MNEIVSVGVVGEKVAEKIVSDTLEQQSKLNSEQTLKVVNFHLSTTSDVNQLIEKVANVNIMLLIISSNDISKSFSETSIYSKFISMALILQQHIIIAFDQDENIEWKQNDLDEAIITFKNSFPNIPVILSRVQIIPICSKNGKNLTNSNLLSQLNWIGKNSLYESLINAPHKKFDGSDKNPEEFVAEERKIPALRRQLSNVEILEETNNNDNNNNEKSGNKLLQKNSEEEVIKLWEFLEKQDFENFQKLFENSKFDLNKKRKAGRFEQTLLYRAVSLGNHKFVEFILNFPEINPNIGMPSPNGEVTPLFEAVKRKDESMVRLLISKRKDLNGSLGEGTFRTCLHSAIMSKSHEIITLLLQCETTDVNQKHYIFPDLCMTPLYAIISKLKKDDHLNEILTIFLKHEKLNPNLGQEKRKSTETPLYSAIANNQDIEVIKALISHSQCDVNEGQADPNGEYISPLFCAVNLNKVDVVRELLSHNDIDPTKGSHNKGENLKIQDAIRSEEMREVIKSHAEDD